MQKQSALAYRTQRYYMASVFDVAKYIVDKIGIIDTWKLQKLLYYCQAWSLVWDERPLFSEKFEAWSNGPVCREFYNLHKGKYEIGPETPVWGNANPDILTVEERETIDVIIRDYGDLRGYELRQLTHLEDPWNQARIGVPYMDSCENEITHDMLRLYYGAL